MAKASNPKQNRILAALPAADYERLLPELKRIALPLGMVLDESGSKWDYVYFPTDSIVSLLNMLQDGEWTEFAVIGNEGVVGIEVFLGGDESPRHALVTSAGSGYRLKASFVKKSIKKGGPLQQAALLYTQALITQMAQTAVCNRHHPLQQQLCRWLLLCLDRLPSNEIKMTQKLIADLLGVRREGITEAARNLQRRGVIKYSRGKIIVLDRAKLEVCVCECYAVVKREYDRLLNHLPAQSPGPANQSRVVNLTAERAAE